VAVKCGGKKPRLPPRGAFVVVVVVVADKDCGGNEGERRRQGCHIGRDRDSVPMWSPVSQYAVGKLRGVC